MGIERGSRPVYDMARIVMVKNDAGVFEMAIAIKIEIVRTV